MFGDFEFAAGQFADSSVALATPTPTPATYQRLVVECKTNDCTGIAADSQSYSLQDALYFNGTPVSVVIICPVGGVGCTPGQPVVVTYPPGTFVFPNVPLTPGEPINLCLDGCQSRVCRALPTGATTAQINAAVTAIIQEVATQQAECDYCPDCAFGALISLGDLPAYACIDYEYDQSVVADTDPTSTPVSFSITGTLPTGITHEASGPSTMFLGGIPTVAGAFNFTVNAQAANGATTAKAYTVTVVGITTAAALTATIDEVYSQALVTSGFTGTLIWGIASGTLPAGLTFNTNTGVISGTPTTLGASTFTVFVQNETQQCLKEFEITVEEAGCSLFQDLTWPYQVTFGTGAGTASGNHLTASGTGGAACDFSSGFSIYGTMNYTGPEVECDVVIVYTGDSSASVKILQDSVEIFTWEPGDGSGTFPVTVGVGVGSLIEITSNDPDGSGGFVVLTASPDCGFGTQTGTLDVTFGT